MQKNKPGQNTIALNKKARHDFIIEKSFEAGLVLEGWELKSLRAGRVQITDNYVLVKSGEAWMIGSHLTPLPSASSHVKAEPDRTRKMLLHRKELDKLIGLVERKGYTLVVLSLYWKQGRVKAEVALAKGKKTHDKRASLKEKDHQREMQRDFKIPK